MVDIALNIRQLKEQIPSSVKIVAVSKTRTVADIMAAYNSGHRIFGENRVQELLDKKEKLPSDIEWHLIGHLQSNKVKYVIPFISMIESVDSIRLLSAINKDAEKEGRVIDCLLQFHIAKEETKYGFSESEAYSLLESESFARFRNVRICGVMGMATFTNNKDTVRAEFKSLKDSFQYIKAKYFLGIQYFNEISMGMSGDYPIAIDEGSTIIRVGSLIFGQRNSLLA